MARWRRFVSVRCSPNSLRFVALTMESLEELRRLRLARLGGAVATPSGRDATEPVEAPRQTGREAPQEAGAPDERFCRICHGGGGLLFSPCCCRGVCACAVLRTRCDSLLTPRRARRLLASFTSVAWQPGAPSALALPASTPARCAATATTRALGAGPGSWSPGSCFWV